jgi:hypothetical protein
MITKVSQGPVVAGLDVDTTGAMAPPRPSIE